MKISRFYWFVQCNEQTSVLLSTYDIHIRIMKYGCCKECACVSAKIRDPGCACKKHDQYGQYGK